MRDCKHCKHLVLSVVNGRGIYACEKWECEYEPISIEEAKEKMQIVVDIPDEVCDWLDNGFPDEVDAEELWQIVKSGTPLKSGRWLHMSIHDWQYDCSECGADSEEPYPYCPNCGARMESEEEE